MIETVRQTETQLGKQEQGEKGTQHHSASECATTETNRILQTDGSKIDCVNVDSVCGYTYPVSPVLPTGLDGVQSQTGHSG